MPYPLPMRRFLLVTVLIVAAAVSPSTAEPQAASGGTVVLRPSTPEPQIVQGGAFVVRGSSQANANVRRTTPGNNQPVVAPRAGWDHNYDTTGFDRRYDTSYDRNYDTTGIDRNVDPNYDTTGSDRNYDTTGFDRNYNRP